MSFGVNTPPAEINRVQRSPIEPDNVCGEVVIPLKAKQMDLGGRALMKAKEKIKDFMEMNTSIQHSVDDLENFCDEISHEKERELLRQHEERLRETQKEIDRLKSRELEFDALYWNKKYLETLLNFTEMSDYAKKLTEMTDASELAISQSNQELSKIKRECNDLTNELLVVRKDIRKFKRQNASMLSSSSPFNSMVPLYSSSDSRSSVSLSHYSALYSKKTPSPFSTPYRVPPLSHPSPASAPAEQHSSAPFITTGIEFSSPTSDSPPGSLTTRSVDRSITLPPLPSKSEHPNPFASVILTATPYKEPLRFPRSPQKKRVVWRNKKPIVKSRTVKMLAHSTDIEIVDALNNLRNEHATLLAKVEQSHAAFVIVEQAKIVTEQESAKLRAFLHECNTDVAKEINTLSSSNIPIEKQRELLSLQTSRQKVINILIEKTFPHFNKEPGRLITITDEVSNDAVFIDRFATVRASTERTLALLDVPEGEGEGDLDVGVGGK